MRDVKLIGRLLSQTRVGGEDAPSFSRRSDQLNRKQWDEHADENDIEHHVFVLLRHQIARRQLE